MKSYIIGGFVAVGSLMYYGHVQDLEHKRVVRELCSDKAAELQGIMREATKDQNKSLMAYNMLNEVHVYSSRYPECQQEFRDIRREIRDILLKEL
jgi:NAD kinase